MSRLDEECIMAVVRNRSGIDAGEIDYSVMWDKFGRLNGKDLRECKKTLMQLAEKCEEQIRVIEGVPCKLS